MKKIAAASLSYLLPVLAFAQGTATGQLNTISGVIRRLQDIINLIIPFIVGLAVLVIIWGVFGYVTSAGDEEKRGEAKQFILWGVIGVFIMVSVWGLVNILVNSFGVGRTDVQTKLLQGNNVQQKVGVPVVTPGTAF
jgi:hypothetical protein